MGRPSIGDAAMTPAERMLRYRAKARAARATENASPARGTVLCPACTPPLAALELHGDAEAIAARLYAAVSVETARGITVALQRRLWQGGSWPQWMPPIIS